MNFLGALMNGLGTNFLAGGDPKKGLMINAALLLGSQGLSSIPGLLGSSAAAAPVSANAMIPGVQGGMGALAGQTTALTAAQTTPSIFANTLGGMTKDISAINQYAGENPILANMALQSALNATQPPPPPQSGGLRPGNLPFPQLGAGMPTQPFMAPRRSLI
jgi:hypothetical protein